MNRSTWSALIALASVAPLPWARSEERPRPLVIRGCSVLDVAGGKMLADRTVVLDGGKIRAIGTPEDPVETPPGASDDRGGGQVPHPGPDRRPRPPGACPGFLQGDRRRDPAAVRGRGGDLGPRHRRRDRGGNARGAVRRGVPGEVASRLSLQPVDRPRPAVSSRHRPRGDRRGQGPGVRGRDGGLGRHVPQDLRRHAPRYRPRRHHRGPQTRTEGRGPPGGLRGAGRRGGRHRRAGTHLVGLQLHHPARGIAGGPTIVRPSTSTTPRRRH